MYKKIMFLIITLSIIINVGNSTVVMAKENIVTEIVDFPGTIVVGSCETSHHYNAFSGVQQMTSNERKRSIMARDHC